jgi:hypothetical protein
MPHASAQEDSTDRAARSSRVFRELHATLRGEGRTIGGDPSLSGVFRRFARSARAEGVLAERVVIALKRAYRAWVPVVHRGRDHRLTRLITVSIESYYARDGNEDGDDGVTPDWQPPDAA